MFKKLKFVAVVSVCVMMFTVGQPASAETWGEWFLNLFSRGNSNQNLQPLQPQGGYYKDIKGTVPGMQSHHIIPDAISPFPRDYGPSVLMTPDDHRKTISYGNSREAQEFRATMSELLRQGKLDDVWQMGLKDLSQFGGKYQPGIDAATQKFEWEKTQMELDQAIKLFDSLGEFFGN